MSIKKQIIKLISILFQIAKYASSFFVVIFSSITMATTGSYAKSTHNPFFYLWIVSAIISSCYAYGWVCRVSVILNRSDFGVEQPKQKIIFNVLFSDNKKIEMKKASRIISGI